MSIGTPLSRLSATEIANLLANDGERAKNPTPEQAAIIEAPCEPLLVVAGAGSGKTETMSMRVLWLIVNEGVPPESILGLTFTRKAAGELGVRLRSRIRILAKQFPSLAEHGDPVSLTYHSFAERVVSEHGLRIGCDPNTRLLGQAGAVQMMTDIVEGWRSPINTQRAPATIVASALSFAGQIAEHDLSVEDARFALIDLEEQLEEIGKPTAELKKILAANKERLELLDLVRVFAERKQDTHVMDFADQLAFATRIVREIPEVVRSLRGEHRVVLLDEFQDTSVIQMEFLSLIFRHHPVTAVGDPNQAIYGWRGASAASLETFHERFNPDCDAPRTATLSVAWRNDKKILQAANVIAKPLRSVSDNPKIRSISVTLKPREKAGEGNVAVAFTRDRESQLEAVADFVETHRVKKGRFFASAVVLCRRTRDFQAVDTALRQRDIPTQVIGLGGLLDQPAVSDVRAACELSVDVTCSQWAMRLLTNLDLGANDLLLLGQWARVLAKRNSNEAHPSSLLVDAIDSPPPALWKFRGKGHGFTSLARERVSVLSQRLRAIRAGRGRGIVEQVERAISILGVLQDIVADPLENTGREALDSFVSYADAYEKSVISPTMRGFLAWLVVAESEERGLSVGNVEPDREAVQIMTVHAAKGLEWDSVAVFACDDGIFPNHRSTSRFWRDAPPGVSEWLTRPDQLPYPARGDRSHLPLFIPDLSEGKTPSSAFNKWIKDTYSAQMGKHHEREERRLAYVALTRARSALLLAGSWMDTGTKLRFPSRYLMEPLHEGATNAHADTDIVPAPDEDERTGLESHTEKFVFPVAPGRTRQLISESAHRVLECASRITAEGTPGSLLRHAEAENTLAGLGNHRLASDVRALLEERALKRESHVVAVSASQLAATRIPALLEDPEGFARTLRRPIPAEPHEASALGTIFHAWAERQLRLASGELWEEPTPGEETLGKVAQEKLDRMKHNFRQLELLEQRPVGVEEPFSMNVEGISIQGRIDAVFEDHEGRFTVVDWKTGRAPSAAIPHEQLRRYEVQLSLYRKAWAQRMDILPEDVAVNLVFLDGPLIISGSQFDLDSVPSSIEADLRCIFSDSSASTS